MTHSRYSTALRVLLLLVLLASGAFWTAGVTDGLKSRLDPQHYVLEPFHIDPYTHALQVLPMDPVEGEMPQDAIVESLNGQGYTGLGQWNLTLRQSEPGDSMSVGYLIMDAGPNDVRGTVQVKLLPQSSEPPMTHDKVMAWQYLVVFQLLPFCCLLIGCWVVFVKPSEPNAWLLLGLLSVPVALFVGPGRAGAVWLFLQDSYFTLVKSMGPALLLPFAIYFPERLRMDRRVPWAKWLVLVPAAVCSGVILWGIYARTFFAHAVPGLVRPEHRASYNLGILHMICIGLYVVLLVAKLRSTSNADARRRLKILVVGTAIGISGPILLLLVLPRLGFHGSSHTIWLDYLGGIIFLLAPFTLAYVVLVQRAMDVRILLRQGTKYALGRATIWGVQALLIGILTYHLVVPLFGKEQISRPELLQIPVFLLLVFGLRVVFQKRVQDWLDRRFFREVYNSEHVLNELSREVSRFTEIDPMLATICQRVSETLHVAEVAFFLREGSEFRLHSTTKQAAFDERSATIRNLMRSAAPVRLYREAPDAWYFLADEDEKDLLDELGVELLLPLQGRNRLIGVMALGSKRSEAAYTKSDVQLLQVLATQTGLAMEVSELAHSLAKAAAQRERANREMEIAREVQERLFPQRLPQVTWGSIAGACRSAQHVGGDYYDVFPLEDGKVGLAIGDVSGKGISAALLMASLRASLRSLMLDRPTDLAELMGKINRLVFEASDNSKYASFFFGVLDPARHELRCVNAGHNPPIVLCRDDAGGWSEMIIEADGPVVGLLPAAVYTEQRVTLRAGDMMLLYTDGISEAMTQENEEWGEKGMVAAASGDGDETAGGVLARVFASADCFTAGAPQHDDMTLLVVKIDASTANGA